MLRLLLCGAMLALVTLPGQAEPTITATEYLVRLNVSPKAAPKPALRYLLLPDLKELNPGNPIPNYLKCLMAQDFNSNREHLSPAGLRQADRAARMDKADWQILLKIKSDGINLLLPDIQKLRFIASELKERFHTEVVENRFDDALATAKTMFSLSRHTGEHPTLIGNLVGIAIAFVAIGPLEEMLEQPDAPNFYWALTNLPSPFLSLDKGFEGERLLLSLEFAELIDTAPMTAEQIKKVIVHADKLRQLGVNTGKTKEEIRILLDNRAQDAAYMGEMRKRFLDDGMSGDLLGKLPTDQLILLDERRAAEIRRDDEMKLMKLPIWQAEEMLAKIKPSAETGIFDILLSAQQRIFRSHARLEQRIALLRHVEALRIYVAEHDGKLPEKLSDFTVPLPFDPITGKPFRYWVEGDTVHFRGTPPPTTEKIPAYNVHYEIKVRGSRGPDRNQQSADKK